MVTETGKGKLVAKPIEPLQIDGQAPMWQIVESDEHVDMFDSLMKLNTSGNNNINFCCQEKHTKTVFASFDLCVHAREELLARLRSINCQKLTDAYEAVY